MEHVLPYPSDSDIRPLTVPHIAYPRYDRTVLGSFRQFPARCGFRAPNGALNVDRSHEDLAEFLQSWLYFGTLEEILEGPILSIQDDIDLRIPDTVGRPLRDHRVACTQTELERVRELITLAQSYWVLFDEINAAPSSKLALVSLSVQILLQHCRHVFGVEDDKFFPLQNWELSSSARTLLSRIQYGGRCPWTAAHACTGLDCIYLYYISSVKRSQRTIQHSTCSPEACQAAGVVPQPKHRFQSCSCVNVRPPLEKIVDIVKTGGIPLISIKSGPGKALTVNVIRCSMHSRYTAVSHVWADNQLCSGTDSNQVYQCQLEHVNNLVLGIKRSETPLVDNFAFVKALWKRSRSARTGLFWLDTLCVPESDPMLRQKAIDQMNLIYARASEVLVLDEELQQIHTGAEDILDLQSGSAGHLFAAPTYHRLLDVLARFISCGWMGRAWTSQEGVLSRDCIVQLAD